MADPTVARKLRQVFEARLQEVAVRTLDAETGPTTAEVESLANLSKLCDLAEASSRWTVATWQMLLLLALILAALTVLFFVEVLTTDLSGNVVAETVTFGLTEKSPVSKGWRGLTSLGITEASKIQFPALGNEPERTVANGGALLEAGSGSLPGEITVAPLSLPEGTRVTITALSPGACRILLQRAVSGPTGEFSVQINATGLLRLKSVDHPPGEFKLTRPAGFTAYGTQSLAFELTAPAATISFQSLLPTNLLDFREVEVAGEGSADQTRVRPTLRSGSLFYESLGGREHKLREAEDLNFGGFSGTIRSLSLKDGAIHVNFEGTVRQVDSHERSLKPSILDFLRAQKPVELLWGSALGLFGAALAALRWFKVNV